MAELSTRNVFRSDNHLQGCLFPSFLFLTGGTHRSNVSFMSDRSFAIKATRLTCMETLYDLRKLNLPWIKTLITIFFVLPDSLFSDLADFYTRIYCIRLRHFFACRETIGSGNTGKEKPMSCTKKLLMSFREWIQSWWKFRIGARVLWIIFCTSLFFAVYLFFNATIFVCCCFPMRQRCQ